MNVEISNVLQETPEPLLSETAVETIEVPEAWKRHSPVVSSPKPGSPSLIKPLQPVISQPAHWKRCNEKRRIHSYLHVTVGRCPPGNTQH